MAALKLAIQGLEPALSVRRFDVRERLSDLFTVSIVAVSPSPDLDPDEVVFRPASFAILAGWAYVRNGGSRHLTGLCESIRQIQAEPSGLSTYSLKIVPHLWLATQRRNYRIFQNINIPDILTQILEEFSITHEWRIGHDDFPRLNYKVQYGESDFAFIRRLCEEAGITFHFEDGETRGTVLVLSDAPCTAPKREGPPLPFVDEPNTSSENEYITRVRLFREAKAGTVTIGDYDFRNPALRLEARASEETKDQRLEQYRYEPGAFRVLFDGPSSTPIADKSGPAIHHPFQGKHRADRLLHGEHAGSLGLSFETNAMDVAPGAVFSMAGHPHPRLDESKGLLVTQLRSKGKHDGEWSTRGRAVLTTRRFRPPRETPKPVVHGLQSAIVTGPPGRDIFTDEYGRVRVQFPWDRYGRADDQSSCWIRVSQGWAGAGFGLWTVPRIGQEVLVGFLEGDPDEPIILGRAPNAHNPAPYPLPAHETKSVWRSQSTPGAGGFNEISFEDRKGEERIYEKAERDKESVIQNDLRVTVGHDRNKLVKNNEQTTIVGDLIELVGGGLHITIKGERRERIEGNQSQTVDGDRNEHVDGRYGIAAGGEIHIKSASKIVLEAPDITLNGGGGFVRVNGGGVVIDGPAVSIQQGGAPGSGTGCSPATPIAPTMAAAFFPTPPKNVRRLPLLGLTPIVPMNIGPPVEHIVICAAICKCKDATKASGRKGAQDCVTSTLRAYDAVHGGQSTIKAEVPYNMTTNPPTPIMSKNHPGPTTGHPKGSQIPDVVVLWDGTKPPTQDNIKKVIEIKFPGDRPTDNQILEYPKIAGSAPYEIWTPSNPCFCPDKEKAADPVADKLLDLLTILALLAAIAWMIGNDATPLGPLDDPLIPPTIAKLLQIAAPLLAPVIPRVVSP